MTHSNSKQAGTNEQSTAVVIGASGQDGYFLTERLLEDNWRVHAIVRRPEALAGLLGTAKGKSHREVQIADLSTPQTLFDLIEREPVLADPTQLDGPTLPTLALRLGRTKTASAEQDERVLLIGRPVEALRAWLEAAGIQKGPVFREITRWGQLGRTALDPQSVNAILKKHCAEAGLDPRTFSAHGLRSGYLTEAARRGVSLQEAMRQSRHRSVQQASSYYNEVEIERGDSARLG